MTSVFPLSSSSNGSSALSTIRRSTLISGQTLRKRYNISGIQCIAMLAYAATLTVSLLCSVIAEIRFSRFAFALKNSLIYGINSSPARVREIPRCPRRISVSPISRSRLSKRCVSPDWVYPTASDAFERLPRSTAVISISSFFPSMLSPLCITNCHITIITVCFTFFNI